MVLVINKQVNNEKSFYTWMETIVIPNMFPVTYSNDDLITNGKDIKYTSDQLGLRLGAPQIRQYRVKPGERPLASTSASFVTTFQSVSLSNLLMFVLQTNVRLTYTISTSLAMLTTLLVMRTRGTMPEAGSP